MAENFNIWDFTLSDEDMAQILALDTGRPIADLNDPELARKLLQLKVHD